MATVRTLRPFFDLVARCDRRPGDEFEATEARYEHIAGKLPGYVELAEADAPDYSAMKVAELRALCSERGLEAPSKATKAQLIEILEG